MSTQLKNGGSAAGARLIGLLLILSSVIASARAEDCNSNGVPDEFDITSGSSLDCNGTWIPDECELAAGTSRDCNGTWIPDECEIVAGTSPDCNGNEIPDECDLVEQGAIVWLVPSEEWTNDIYVEAMGPGGVIVGQARRTMGEYRAFRFDPSTGAMTDLGALGGTGSGAMDVNATGQIVGWAETAAGEGRAFAWEAGVMRELGSLGGPFDLAEAVSDSGIIVGSVSGPTGASRAATWIGAVTVELGLLGDFDSQAAAVNERGQIIGRWTGSGGIPRSFSWKSGVMTDLGSLGDAQTEAQDLNEYGVVVGSSQTGGHNHAFQWKDGIITDLGTLGGSESHAHALNDEGTITGESMLPNGYFQAVIWRDGVPQVLPGLGGTDSYALTIDNQGQVAGLARDGSGTYRAVRWRPPYNLVEDLNQFLPPGSIEVLTDVLFADDAGWYAGYGDNGAGSSLYVLLVTRQSADCNGNGVPDECDVAVQHEISGLGSLGGSVDQTTATALNNSGQIVGAAQIPAWWMHAFIWQQGVMTDLGTLGGNYSWAHDVNASGVVVGQAETANGEYRAFRWQDGIISSLGTLGGNYSTAQGVNSSGIAVGEATISNGQSRAFRWEDGVLTSLGTLGGSYSSAVAVNNSGMVIGDSQTGSGRFHAFSWDAGVMTDLGTLGGEFSHAVALNDAGQVIGDSALASGLGRAFRWHDGVLTDLGTLPGDDTSQAIAIDAAGRVLCQSMGPSGQHPFVWENGMLRPVTGLGGDLVEARDINDQGQVVGMSNAEIGGIPRAFVWDDGVCVALDTLLPAGSTWSLWDVHLLNNASMMVGIGTNGLDPGIQTFALRFSPGTSSDCDTDGVPDECEGDCNSNGVSDACDIALGTSRDCQRNLVPDECDVAAGLVEDCNLNQIPDVCEICPPEQKLDVVFLLDGSGSMALADDALCSNGLADALAAIELLGLDIDTEILSIHGMPPTSGPVPRPWTDCTEDSVANRYGVTTPGLLHDLGPSTYLHVQGTYEDWGPAVAIVAVNKPWRAGAVRLIVPAFDEGPRWGNPILDPGAARDALEQARLFAAAYAVVVAPLVGDPWDAAVVEFAEELASGGRPGGSVMPLFGTSPQAAAAVRSQVEAACRTTADCDGNLVLDACDITMNPSLDLDDDGVLDACEADCNSSAIPDHYEIQIGIAGDCNSNAIPDACEADCNANGWADDCDIAAGRSADCNTNGTPDECELAAGTADDCNGTGVLDACELAAGTSADCDGDSEPDECSGNVNTNAWLDACEYAVWPQLPLAGVRHGGLVDSPSPTSMYDRPPFHAPNGRPDGFVFDDWYVTDDRPISEIHWWGVYSNGWQEEYPPEGAPEAFHLGVWTNVLGNEGHEPDELIWEALVPRSELDETPEGYARQAISYHPDPAVETVFKYTYHVPAAVRFTQDSSTNQRYWLSIAAVAPSTYSACACDTDINDDSVINALDVLTIRAPHLWLCQTENNYDVPFNDLDVCSDADVNCDGVVNTWDVEVVTSACAWLLLAPTPAECCLPRWGWLAMQPQWGEPAVAVGYYAPHLGDHFGGGLYFLDKEEYWDMAFSLVSDQLGPPQGCCTADNLCHDPLAWECVRELDGIPQGVATACTAEEACCDLDDSCSMLDPLCCDDDGGTPQGAGSACTAEEACCLPSGCSLLDPVCCTSAGGSPQGAGSACTEPQACCLPDETCADLDPLCCLDQGGVVEGSGTACTGLAACCLPDGTCDDLDALCCADQEGDSLAPGTACTSPQACCLPDGTCAELDPLCCQAMQGHPQGPTSQCGTAISCCLPDGACAVLAPTCCAAASGSAAIAPPCRGDLNSTGIDDACEQCATLGGNGDADLDGWVTDLDYVAFAGCLAGPRQWVDEACAFADLDADCSVDLRDFAVFQQVYEDSIPLLLLPSDDAMIVQENPAGNLGSSPELRTRNWDGAGAWDQYELASLIRFDVSAWPSGTTVHSATLNLYYYGWIDTNPSGRSLRCRRLTGPWAENAVTWGNRPGQSTTVTSSATVPSAVGRWMSWNVTADVQAFVNGASPNYGWIVRDEQPWGGPNIPYTRFRSKEYGDYRPYLAVTYSVPPPAPREDNVER